MARLAGLLLGGCHGTFGCGKSDSPADTGDTTDTSDSDTAPPSEDLDGDRQSAGDGDCDDTNPTVHLGAQEIGGDGIDQNCDGIDNSSTVRGHDAALLHIVGANLPSDQWLGSNLGGELFLTSDLDLDGLTDLVIAGPTLFYDPEGPPSRPDPSVWMIQGTLRGEVVADEIRLASWSGEPMDNFGSVLARCGDLDADGHDDVGVGAMSSDGDGGFVGVYSIGSQGQGQSTDYIFGVDGEPGSWTGAEVSGIYDVDSDGNRDLIVYTWTGLRVFSDPNPGRVSIQDADFTIPGQATFSPYGTRSPDFDSDGHDDVVVSTQDSVEVVQGPFPMESPTSLFTIDSPEYGNWAVSIGDINGDNALDVAYGVASYPSAGTQSGRVGFFLGPLSGSRPFESSDATLDAEHDNVGLSRGLAISGDLDGNGEDDIVVGAPGVYAIHTGAVVIFDGIWSGTRTTADADLVLDGSEAGDAFGWTLSTDGDLDGDGIDDLVVGAPYENDWRGSVRTFSGAPLMGLIEH